jgi:FAD/FMN-containing dehydrogenase
VFERLLEQALEQGMHGERRRGGRERRPSPQAVAHPRKHSAGPGARGLNIKHDISLPISSIAAFVDQAERTLAQAIPGMRLVNFGHLGDGNLHFNVQAPAFLQTHEDDINTLVYDSVKAFDGSISAEHGVGSLKVHTLPHYKDPVALALMRRVKDALDPNNLMNPGRVLG